MRQLIPVSDLYKRIRKSKKTAGAFTRIPNAFVFDTDLKDQDFRALAVLLSYQSWHDRDSVVWPSIDTLISRLGISRRTLERRLKCLEEAGYTKRTLLESGLPAFEIFSPAGDSPDSHSRMVGQTCQWRTSDLPNIRRKRNIEPMGNSRIPSTRQLEPLEWESDLERESP